MNANLAALLKGIKVSMTVNINVLNASGKFDPVLSLLEHTCDQIILEVKQVFTLPSVDICISPASEEYITVSGIMGCVTTPYVIDILLDTSRSDLVNIIENELAATLAHELHHLVRLKSGIEDSTLFEHLITEGLACHFEAKCGQKEMPGCLAEIQTSSWLELYDKMKVDLNNQDFDYRYYFAGTTGEIPKHAGYWVGFNLVTQYIEKNGGSAVSLAMAPAAEFQLDD